MRLATLLALPILAAGLGGCLGAFVGEPEEFLWPLYGKGEAWPTVAGPEDPEIRGRVSGTLVLVLGRYEEYAPPHASLEVCRLSDGERRLIDAPEIVGALSGPDEHGRLAYLTRRRTTPKGAFERTCIERASVLDGIASVVVDDLADGELYPWAMSLSPSGNKVALQRAEHSPPSSDQPWFLEVHDLETGATLSWPLVHQPWGGMAWLPGENQLLFDEADACTYELDLPANKIEKFCEGHSPMVRPDGTVSVVGVGARRVTSTGELVIEDDRKQLPGFVADSYPFEIIADLGGGLILYSARPTEGHEQVRLPYRPHMHPMTKWSIKCADLKTGHFVTILDNVAYDRFTYSPAEIK